METDIVSQVLAAKILREIIEKIAKDAVHTHEALNFEQAVAELDRVARETAQKFLEVGGTREGLVINQAEFKASPLREIGRVFQEIDPTLIELGFGRNDGRRTRQYYREFGFHFQMQLIGKVAEYAAKVTAAVRGGVDPEQLRKK